ncbi:hypothetical protein ACLKA6_006547 [Drosophila palustris]
MLARGSRLWAMAGGIVMPRVAQGCPEAHGQQGAIRAKRGRRPFKFMCNLTLQNWVQRTQRVAWRGGCYIKTPPTAAISSIRHGNRKRDLECLPDCCPALAPDCTLPLPLPLPLALPLSLTPLLTAAATATATMRDRNDNNKDAALPAELRVFFAAFNFKNLCARATLSVK